MIDQKGIGLLTMTKALVDILPIYFVIAMMGHLLMSIGQTLFHRYLGHSRLGGRFFKKYKLSKEEFHGFPLNPPQDYMRILFLLEVQTIHFNGALNYLCGIFSFCTS